LNKAAAKTQKPKRPPKKETGRSQTSDVFCPMASVQALGSFLCCIFEFQLGLRENLLAQIQFKSDYHHLAVSDTTPNSGPKNRQRNGDPYSTAQFKPKSKMFPSPRPSPSANANIAGQALWGS